MTKRFISGIFCILFLVLTILLTRILSYTLNIVISLITLLSVYELISVKKERIFSILSAVSMLFSMVRSLVGPGTRWKAALYIYTVICFIIAMIRFVNNKNKNKSYKSVWNVCFIFFFNILISVCLGTIVELRNYGGDSLGTFLILLSFGMASSCDIGSYLIGKKFGKNKLCPYISPKKTIEGAIGGIIFTVVFALLFSILCSIYFNIKPVNYIVIFFISILGAPISIFGDLCFSLIKRILNVKDFSNTIPGHGGVLDRLDSVMFLSPFIFIFLHFFYIIR